MVKLMEHYIVLGYEVYAPDMPGFGCSFDPTPADKAAIKEHGVTWYTNIYVQMFKELGIWQTRQHDNGGVHILGHHSGAALALELGATYPEVVCSVCMVGPSIMPFAQRMEMKGKLLHAFNEPRASGEHLLSTWQYLGRHGLTSHGVSDSTPTACTTEDLLIWQREAIDHIRAWEGRMQIYEAVFSQDGEELLRQTNDTVNVMVCCAKDDILWPFFGNAKAIRSEVMEAVVEGSNWSVDRDTEGIFSAWTPFITK